MLIRSLPAYSGQAQQKNPAIEKNVIPQLLMACLQPVCVHAVSLSARRCCGVRNAADVLILVTLLAWAGSKSSCLDVNWPPCALPFLYSGECEKMSLTLSQDGTSEVDHNI